MGNILKRLKTNVVISAVLCILLGIVLVVWPDISMQIACTAIADESDHGNRACRSRRVDCIKAG